jgi:tetratricopeptide (TPR) repeat protein
MSRPLTVDDVAALLPDLEELRPVIDHVLARSLPDPGKAWSGSGALGSAGERRVAIEDVIDGLGDVTAAEEAHRAVVFAAVAQALHYRAVGSAEECALALLEAAAAEESRHRFPKAEAYADAAYRALDQHPDAEPRRRALRRRARARRALGAYEAAGADYQRAFEMAAATADIQGGAEAAIGAGNCFEDQARWDQALLWYRWAVHTMEQNDYSGPERWQAHLNEHIVRRSMGDLVVARETLEHAELAASGYEGADVFIENAWGQWHLAAGDLEAAEFHLRSALALGAGGRAQVTVRLNLAETLLAAGRSLEAAEEVRFSEYEAIVARAPAQLPEVYRLLGRISMERGEGDAFVLFEKALSLVAEQGLPEIERARTLQVYADAEDRSGDPVRADELRTEASRIYRELGIGERSRWVDRHEAAPDNNKAQDTDE